MPDESHKADACAEHGTWTTPPTPPPHHKALDFATIDANENQRIVSSGSMTFAMVGCSGDPDSSANTKAVGDAIARSSVSSFFFHLGDVTYTPDEKGGGSSADDSTADDEHVLWNAQFYQPYNTYAKQIVSIAGNHDGKDSKHPKQSQIGNYLANFCADASTWPQPWPHNKTDKRPAMIQPYVYWRFDTPLAYIIGLYTNVVNGGMLDAPSADFTKGAQYMWLVHELKKVAEANQKNPPKKAVLLALHYPPYSGATNFGVRGDQSKGPTPNAAQAPYLAVALQQAFKDAGQRPDAIFSAHAHLFQRLSYTYADGTVMPCLVAGCGGHSPLERLFEECAGGAGAAKKTPFAAVAPGLFQFPKGDSATVEYFDDHTTGGSFGFLRVTVEKRVLSGQFVDTSGKVRDRFSLDLDSHQYR